MFARAAGRPHLSISKGGLCQFPFLKVRRSDPSLNLETASFFCLLARDESNGLGEAPDMTLWIFGHVAAITVELICRLANDGSARCLAAFAVSVYPFFSGEHELSGYFFRRPRLDLRRNPPIRPV